MPYPWECIDCDEYYEDLVKNGKFYCNKMHQYVLVHEHSCSTYFVKRDKNRPLKTKPNDCYITTAIVNILGYEDNCDTLEKLRDFRDNYMKHQEYCLPLLEDYDVVGPLISEELLKDENKVKQAKRLLNGFIKEALDAIKDREYDSAVDLYVNMTEFLMDWYDIDMTLLSYNKKEIQRKREINY